LAGLTSGSAKMGYNASMNERKHLAVLVKEVLEALRLEKAEAPKVIVDCTVGFAGHAAEILRHVARTGGRVIGIDFDAGSLAAARERLGQVRGGKGRFELVQNNFAALPTVLAQCGVEKVDGILADLGVSSPQIDDAGRGFSYRQKGPLDMRMDPSRGTTAAMLVNRLPEAELAAALFEYGDETDAPAIARIIIERRRVKPIETTQELTAVVCQARRFTLQRAAGAKLHPAARTFQALRILVNRELANLDRLLAVAPECLNPGGIVAIISFHSGEDRRVKKSFREGYRAGIYSETSPDVIVAGEEERLANPRARSAKLRWARRA
jgi:16S rRNA (cytosine1402-N4)-methyltransferase